MHLLVAQSGAVDDGSEPRDLGQTPGSVVVLSAADTELTLIAEAHRQRLNAGCNISLRLANILHLKHNYSVDLYLEKTLSQARLVVVRLLGGRSYWSYGFERLSAMAADGVFDLVVLPGDAKPDASIADASTVAPEFAVRLWDYLCEGGLENAIGFLGAAAAHITDGEMPPPARPLLKAGVYGAQPLTGDERPVAGVIFYRALLQSGDLAAIDALLAELDSQGFGVLAIYVTSLRDEVCAATVARLLENASPCVILNTTSFATTKPGVAARGGVLAILDVPVLQVVLASEPAEAWRDGTRGLSARDIAMHVSLPEVDGRILTRAVSFKADARFDEACEYYLVRAEPEASRINFVARQARAWALLAETPRSDQRVGLILANYPNRDGRIGNGVGLDTPQSTVALLKALSDAGYDVADAPRDGNVLIEMLQEGVTNAGSSGRIVRQVLTLEAYTEAFGRLPEGVRAAVTERWGAMKDDPFWMGNGFAIGVCRFGSLAVGIQPARGYNIDPKSSYHDPALVPPHNYFAFYIWLRETFGAHALVHLGKHGNLEWLPGKALALSSDCFPEAVLGALPNIYPFIVNDPGEGSQAKRRTSAVIIDHLTPPMTRAETYGPLKELETLVDEYYEAQGVDERRRLYLQREILVVSARLGLDKDFGLDDGSGNSVSEDAALQEIDNHLCELKELQIRDGLHTLGHSPAGVQRRDLLIALARVPRGDGVGGDASLLRAVCDDLQLGCFDPLDCVMSEVWDGPRPDVLRQVSEDRWRSQGDTVERVEILCQGLVDRTFVPPEAWQATRAVIGNILDDLAVRVDASGEAETAGILAALGGRFVMPGPSGAPTRGRSDVLPTGRNFYSLDSRTLPTRAAWVLGQRSAELVVERYVQEHGDWPRNIALSAWGTANMRTGGDDIAQALALMGVKPEWEPASGRVPGFEIIPLATLGRPRVDVTFRVSGFFRDAFPAQIDLIDSAVRAVAALDEPDDQNPLAAQARIESCELEGQGMAAEAAQRVASARVFGSKPGAYGAGLQALIDEGGWEGDADLAEAYLTWGQYAYGAGLEGASQRGALERRLGQVQVVLHNQDNREHDILDSDDYYQFQGGLAVAAGSLQGRPVKVYHGDHSRPERPVIRTLEEEIGRVVRGRAANPKWIAGVMRHGYKGAFEIAATVDYLFAFSATTGAVGDHHFDALYDAYIGDEGVQGFLRDNNSAALREIADRFVEAVERGLWSPRRNSVRGMLDRLRGTEIA